MNSEQENSDVWASRSPRPDFVAECFFSVSVCCTMINPASWAPLPCATYTMTAPSSCVPARSLVALLLGCAALLALVAPQRSAASPVTTLWGSAQVTSAPPSSRLLPHTTGAALRRTAAAANPAAGSLEAGKVRQVSTPAEPLFPDTAHVNAGVTLAGASSISNPMWSLVALVAAVCGGLVYYRRRQGPEVREFCMAALTADDRRFLRAPLRHTRTRLNAEMHSPFEGGAMVETPEGEGPYDVLTEENVERVLNEMRPYLMADGGNVELVEIDGPIVYLKLQGACGSCTSSAITMTQGIKKRLMAVSTPSPSQKLFSTHALLSIVVPRLMPKWRVQQSECHDSVLA